jgi:ribosome-binding factor A
MIRDALVEVFRHDLRGIDLGIASVTDVEVSPDLHYARIYMSGLEEKQTKETVAQLQEAKGQIRYSLGKRIRLRYLPELDFKYDETTMRASRIEAILAQVLPPKPPVVETDEDEDLDSDGNAEDVDETSESDDDVTS